MKGLSYDGIYTTASVITRCVPCLASQAHNAISAGASRDEIIEAAAIGVEFGGGPGLMLYKFLT